MPDKKRKPKPLQRRLGLRGGKGTETKSKTRVRSTGRTSRGKPVVRANLGSATTLNPSRGAGTQLGLDLDDPTRRAVRVGEGTTSKPGRLVRPQSSGGSLVPVSREGRGLAERSRRGVRIESQSQSSKVPDRTNRRGRVFDNKPSGSRGALARVAKGAATGAARGSRLGPVGTAVGTVLGVAAATSERKAPSTRGQAGRGRTAPGNRGTSQTKPNVPKNNTVPKAGKDGLPDYLRVEPPKRQGGSAGTVTPFKPATPAPASQAPKPAPKQKRVFANSERNVSVPAPDFSAAPTVAATRIPASTANKPKKEKPRVRGGNPNASKRGNRKRFR